MKTIVSAVIALSVLAAVAAPASAAEFDTKKFWQEQGQRF
jgi:Ni/Co efflux regulator RcnB